MFNLVGFGEGDEVVLPGLRMRLVSIEGFERMADVPAKFDLTLYGREEAPAIRLVLEYNADLLEHGTAERMLDRLRVVLASMAADPDLGVRAFGADPGRGGVFERGPGRGVVRRAVHPPDVRGAGGADAGCGWRWSARGRR